MARIGNMAAFFQKSLIVLFCASIVSSLDLSALIPGGGAHQLANLKSIMNPDLLNKMKGMLPKSPLGSSPDVSEIEKLIGKLKPAEGRFDPAMMEFLANLDSSKRKNRPRVPSRSKGNGQDHETTTPTSPSTTQSPPDEAEDDEKPKFSSRFRLPPQHPGSQNSEDSSGPLPDHITDPNIRNHRLYDDSFQDSDSHSHHGQERYENYENFTTIDQLEDLMADESYSAPHVVVAVPVTTTATPRVSRHGVSPSYEHTTPRHPYKRRPSTMTPTLRRPSMAPSTTVSSFEDFISLESFERHPHSDDEDDDMGPFHDREPLNLASTERTVSYPDEFPHNYPSSTEGLNDVDEGSSSTVKTGSGGGFKPSPLDLSPPVYFVPGQDFYTTTLKNHGHKKSGPRIKIVSNKKPAPSSQITRRRQSSAQEEYTGDHESSPSDQWQQFDGYPKDQPNYHHAADYYKKQQELIPTKNAFVHPSRYTHHSNRPGGQMTQSPSSIVPQSLPPPLMSPKQDRVLNGVGGGGTTYTYSSQNYAPTPAYSDSFGYQQQNPSASENVYHDLQMHQMNPYTSNPNNNYLPIQSDLSHSAGQNYYATNPVVAPPQHQPQQPYQAPGHHSYSASSAHGYADQQAHDSGHHHNLHHHGGGHHETSSWSSTFFVLGGLVALSGIIAFLLPTFLATAGATAGGKDTGDDKISHDETDLWSEIKALYNDIVHIAKGDYASYVHNGGSYKNDLPKIKYQEIDDESEDAANSTTTFRTSQSEEDFQSVHRLGYPIRTPGSAEDEDTTSSGADEEDSIESNEQENRVQDSKPTKKSKRKTTPSFHNPFIPYNTTTLQPTPPGRDNGINFAHAFNQTLHAWEVVPLIPT